MTGPLAPRVVVSPYRAMSFIMPPSAVTSTSSVIIRITTVHPFATSWPSSPKGDARTLRDWLYGSYVTQYPVPPIFSFPLEGKSREAGKGVRGRVPIGCSFAILTANRRPPERSDAQRTHFEGAERRTKCSESFPLWGATFLHNPWHQGPEARWMPYAPLRRRRRPLREYWKAPPRSRSRPRRKMPY